MRTNVLGSGTADAVAIVAVNAVTLDWIPGKTRTPPLVFTGENVHCSRNAVPEMGPMELSMFQVSNAAFVGPAYRSGLRDARPKPTSPETLFTNVSVDVRKLNVPTPLIEIDAEVSLTKNPSKYEVTLLVLAISVMVKAVPVNDVAPIVPEPTPVWVNVMVSA
jgi:hypothetical protein